MKVRALVTGASRGLGAAIAKELANRGHYVILNYRSQDDLARGVLDEIESSGGHGELAKFDVADGDACESIIGDLIEEGPIQILVNNAGINSDAPFPGLDRDAWHSVLRSSLDGFYYVTQPIVMPMLRTRWGRIINMSSVSGMMGNRGQVNYSAAKAGIIGATRSLAQELGRRGITVNAVAPGFIESDMTAAIDPEVREQVLRMIPMRRFGQPQEVAKLVGFLTSEDAAYITGQVLSINGGMV